jgi:hypothetical protein
MAAKYGRPGQTDNEGFDPYVQHHRRAATAATAAVTDTDTVTVTDTTVITTYWRGHYLNIVQ